jgi:hypothetical protein
MSLLSMPVVGEEQRHLDVPELVKPVDVIRLHLVSGDDQDVIRQLPLGKVFEYGEGVRSHLR